MKNFVFSDHFHQIIYIIPAPSPPAPRPSIPAPRHLYPRPPRPRFSRPPPPLPPYPRAPPPSTRPSTCFHNRCAASLILTSTVPRVTRITIGIGQKRVRSFNDLVLLVFERPLVSGGQSTWSFRNRPSLM